MTKKILIMTDSVGNPQPYLGNDSTNLEETFPFLIKKALNNTIFHQISAGHAMSSYLIGQARGYISNWKPDYILMCSGYNDAAPVFFSDTEKKILFKYLLINKIGGSLKNFVKKKIFYNNNLFWIRSKPRENNKNFLINLKKFVKTFEFSKIYWYEIFSGSNNKNILESINNFNQILQNEKSVELIIVKDKLANKISIAKDNIHLNSEGHKIFAKSFLDLIKD
jgi:hypothetical protein